MWRAGVVALAGLVSGCWQPVVVRSLPLARSSANPVSTALPLATPQSLEVPLESLPNSSPVAPPAEERRGLTESLARDLAAQHSPVANRLDQDNARPSVQIVARHATPPPTNGEELLREVRYWVAIESRHRDAAEAVDRFYQLADADGRTERLRAGLAAFDEWVALAPKFRDSGLPTLSVEEFANQRLKLLADLRQAESGIQLLNAELLTRLGLGTKSPTRLTPQGDFGIHDSPSDREALVANALANRAELRAIRTLYHGLTADTLLTVEDQLSSLWGWSSTSSPMGANNPLALLTRPVVQRLLEKRLAPIKEAAADSLDVRKQQLHDLIVEREAVVAAEVRTAFDQLAASRERIGIQKARVERWQAKALEARQSGKNFDRFPAELEWQRSRADLIAEIMTWHRWHARLRAAQGVLVPPLAE